MEMYGALKKRRRVVAQVGLLPRTLQQYAYMSTLRHSYGVSVILASLKTSVPETNISVI